VLARVYSRAMAGTRDGPKREKPRAKAKRRARGEGSIYRDEARGGWRAAVVDEVTGKRRYIRAKSQAEAIAKRDELRAKLGQAPRAGEALTVAEWIDGWMRSKASRIRPKTAEGYRSHIEHHITPMLGRLRLSQLTPARLQGFVDHLTARGMHPVTVARVVATLRSALNTAVRQGVLDQSPARAVELPRTEQYRGAYLDQAQAERFLEVVRGHRWGALYTVLITTGLRLGEALGLQWADIDFDSGQIRVTKQAQQQSGTWRLVPPKAASAVRVAYAPPVALASLRLHREAMQALRETAPETWPAEFEGWVWLTRNGRPIQPSNVSHELEGILEGAGLPRIRVHDLRHSAATILLALGVDIRTIQAILGHSSPTLTMRTYSHVVDSLLRDAAERLQRGIGGSGSAPDAP